MTIAAEYEYLQPVVAEAVDEFSLPALVSAEDLPDGLELVIFMMALLVFMGLGWMLGQML